VNPQVIAFIEAAITQSVRWSPRDYGLTAPEIIEVLGAIGRRPGEINDALAYPLFREVQRNGRYLPHLAGMANVLSADFNIGIQGDFRKPEAFEFVRKELVEMGRELGEANAFISRDTLVERAASASIDRHDAEVAITICLLAGRFQQKGDTIGHSPGQSQYPLPSVQRQAAAGIPALESMRRSHNSETEQLSNAVRDVISRRSDARPRAARPLDAFESQIASLGQERFKLWWVQTRSEVKLANPSTQPTTVLVLAASLAEAALSFVVARAQGNGLMSRIDAAKPKQWNFAELVKGSKSGNPDVDPILDEATAARALKLNTIRQRIHVGDLIEAHPTGRIPDLRPEEADDALQTLDLVVRGIVDWLARHPAAAPGR
jgi:hypothetical protein